MTTLVGENMRSLGKSVNNLEKAQMLEAHYLKQIQALIELHEGQNELGRFIYGNENTLQSILSRAKNSKLKDKFKTPWKLMSLYRVLHDYDLVKKKSRGNAV